MTANALYCLIFLYNLFFRQIFISDNPLIWSTFKSPVYFNCLDFQPSAQGAGMPSGKAGRHARTLSHRGRGAQSWRPNGPLGRAGFSRPAPAGALKGACPRLRPPAPRFFASSFLKEDAKKHKAAAQSPDKAKRNTLLTFLQQANNFFFLPQMM